MRIERASAVHRDAWRALRVALWPDSEAEAAAEIDAMLAQPEGGQIAWLAFEDDTPVGLAEASLRHDYVNGCETSPVAFLEGIYVVPRARRRGVGRMLNEAVAAWAIRCGCTEYASDAELGNQASHAFHVALGFAETERIVCFRRMLA